MDTTIEPKLIYDSTVHGYNVRDMLSKTIDLPKTFYVMKSAVHNRVFGAFMNAPFNKAGSTKLANSTLFKNDGGFLFSVREDGSMKHLPFLRQNDNGLLPCLFRNGG